MKVCVCVTRAVCILSCVYIFYSFHRIGSAVPIEDRKRATLSSLKSIWFHSSEWKILPIAKSYHKTLSPHDLFILKRVSCHFKIENLIRLSLFLRFSKANFGRFWFFLYYYIICSNAVTHASVIL